MNLNLSLHHTNIILVYYIYIYIYNESCGLHNMVEPAIGLHLFLYYFLSLEFTPPLFSHLFLKQAWKLRR